MGDFIINTLGTGSNPEILVWLDEVTIDKKEGQSTFTYGSNSGLRRLSEEVPWAWKKAWPRKEPRKTSFGHCRNYRNAQINLGRTMLKRKGVFFWDSVPYSSAKTNISPISLINHPHLLKPPVLAITSSEES